MAGGTATEREVGLGELRLPAEPAQLGAARRYAHGAALACGMAELPAYELAYAVNEAVTNAIRHGTPDDCGRIRLTAEVDAEYLTIEVHDHGAFAQPSEARAPDGEGGRGLDLMARFVDAVRLTIRTDGTAIRLVKRRR